MIKHILRFTIIFLPITFMAQAQTLTFTIDSGYTCQTFSAANPNCYGVPITDNASGEKGSLWIDYTISPTGWVMFLDNFDGLAGAYNPPYSTPWDIVTSSGVSSHSTGTNTTAGTATTDFKGVDGSGREFTGKLQFTFTTYIACAHGCRTNGRITGGTVAVAY